MTNTDREIQERIDRPVSDPREAFYETLAEGVSRGEMPEYGETLEAYNITKTPFQRSRRELKSCCVAKGEMYFAGVNTAYSTNTNQDQLFYKYNPKTETVVRLDDIPDGNNNVYLRYDEVTDRIIHMEHSSKYHVFDVESQVWTQSQSFPDFGQGVENGGYDFSPMYGKDIWYYALPGNRDQRVTRNYRPNNIELNDYINIESRRNGNTWEPLDGDDGNKASGIWTDNSAHYEGRFSSYKLDEYRILMLNRNGMCMVYDMENHRWRNTVGIPVLPWEQHRYHLTPIGEHLDTSPQFWWTFGDLENNEANSPMQVLDFNGGGWRGEFSKTHPSANTRGGAFAYSPPATDEDTGYTFFKASHLRRNDYATMFDIYNHDTERWGLLSAATPGQSTYTPFYDDKLWRIGGSNTSSVYFGYYDIDDDFTYTIDKNTRNIEGRYEVGEGNAVGALERNGTTYIHSVGGNNNSNNHIVLNTETLELDNRNGYPHDVRDAAFATFDNELYVCGGYDNSNSNKVNDFYKYNPQINSWSQLNPLPDNSGQGTREEFGAGWITDSNGDAYMIIAGGDSNNDSREKSVYAYNPRTDSWTQRADMPTGVRYNDAVGYDNMLFVVGGDTDDNEDYSARVWKYDYDADSWSVADRIHPDLYNEESSGVRHPVLGKDESRGLLHIHSGRAQSGRLRGHYVFNLDDEEIVTPTQSPFSIREVAMGATEDYAVIVGGDDSQNRNDPAQYDIENDTWERIENKWNIRSHRKASAIGYDGWVYWLGERSGSNEMYRYNPEMQTYEQATHMDENREKPAIALNPDDEEIYLVGSNDNESGDTSLEVFDINEQRDTENYNMPFQVRESGCAFYRDGEVHIFNDHNGDVRDSEARFIPERGDFAIGEYHKHHMNTVYRGSAVYARDYDMAFAGGGEMQETVDNDHTSTVRTVWEYDDNSRQWIPKAVTDDVSEYHRANIRFRSDRHESNTERFEHSIVQQTYNNRTNDGELFHYPIPAQTSIEMEKNGEVVLFAEDDEAAVRINHEGRVYPPNEPIPVEAGDTVEYYSTSPDARLAATW